MDKEENYISLQEATKFCNYTQEYLSLRARSGKLKAAKFGRNWVTKKEWVAEYVGKAEEYKNNFSNGANHKIEPAAATEASFAKLGLVPENLPVELAGQKFKLPIFGLRIGFLAALVFALLTNNIALGKESFKNVFGTADPYIGRIGLNADTAVKKNSVQILKLAGQGQEGAKIVLNNIAGFSQSFEDVAGDASVLAHIMGSEADRFWFDFGQSFLAVSDSLKEVDLGTADFSQVAQGISQAFGKIKSSYSAANDFAEDKIAAIGKEIPKKYLAVNSFVEQKISEAEKRVSDFGSKIGNQVSNFGKIVVSPWKNVLPEKMVEIEKEDLEALQKDIQELKEKSGKEIIREVEVSKVTRVEPVKEVTREVVKVDEASLKQVRAQLVEMEDAISKRLYAPGGVITQQIYIKEPVASPKIYQENADIVLQTAGSGNVILSAATGMQIAGSQVVIDSTSINNPLVYIADKTRIGGETTIDGTLNAGATNFYGNMIVKGNFTLTGTTNFSGPFTISTSSDSTSLTVIQNGSGKVADFYNTSSATDTAFRITNLGSGNSFLVEDSASTDATPFLIDASGNVAIGTTTAGALFSVATSTNIFNVLTSGRVGLGTSSPAEVLSVTGNILGSGNIVVQGTATSTFGGGATISGYVGLGTTAPDYNLHIAGGTNSFALFTDTDSGETASHGTLMGIGDNNDFQIWNYENTNMLFTTNNAER